MHELGVLCQVVTKVNDIASQNNIRSIRHITLEVGEASGFVPVFLEKLFPAAVDRFPAFQNAKLNINLVPGKNLVIKDIGY